MVARVGEVPPAAGRRRTEYCLEKGLLALVVAQRRYGPALVALTDVPQLGITGLPGDYPLQERHPAWLRDEVGERRMWQWRAIRARTSKSPLLAEGGEIRRLVSSGLRSAIDAYDWLDDVCQDLPADETVIDIGSFDVDAGGNAILSDLRAGAHRYAHLFGELNGGLFGCEFRREEDDYWYDSCALQLMHFRFGLSIGFTARRVCAVCSLDAGDCDHIPGRSYASSAGGPDLVAELVMRDPVMHETTLTPRPRDPLCRVKSVSIDPRVISAISGRYPKSADRILNDECLYPCAGFESPDLDKLFPATT